MMDEDDEDANDSPPAAVDADGDAAMADTPTSAAAAAAVDETAALDGPAQKADDGGKEKDVTTTGGKRRGKRRVMKKGTFVDADGYLVTREEAAWESFEEDEPVEAKRPEGRRRRRGQEQVWRRGDGEAGEHHVLLCEAMTGLQPSRMIQRGTNCSRHATSIALITSDRKAMQQVMNTLEPRDVAFRAAQIIPQ